MWRALPGIVFLLIIAVLFFATYKKTTNEGGIVGQAAPELHVEKIEGLKHPPAAGVLFKHQIVLVNFFASWCTPCLAEHPFLNQLANEYDLRIVGIAWRDSDDNIRAMLKEHGNPYSYIAADRMDSTAFGFGVKGLPESFLIGPDGNIITSHRGPLTPDVIRAKIIPHL